MKDKRKVLYKVSKRGGWHYGLNYDEALELSDKIYVETGVIVAIVRYYKRGV